MESADASDLALYERLKIDDKKIDEMIRSLKEVEHHPEPLNKERYRYTHPNGMTVVNRTAPFGTILIIYESRPDVTIEAAAIAFKTGNKILLKGGKEARNSNLLLVNLWHQALKENGFDENLIQYLDYTREQTTDLLKNSAKNIDLVVPRGGDSLIAMVKSLSSAPVLISGRGNNFIYVAEDADLELAKQIILNSKLQKLGVCNATDKVIFDERIPNTFIDQVSNELLHANCEVIYYTKGQSDAILYEEFLAAKIVFLTCDGIQDVIDTINKYSGKHTAVIITSNAHQADLFMQSIDAASVIHNASSRFTDGGQFGLGAELAISTDKLHHRGPLGLDHLVTNKWYVYGEGQIRK